MSKETPFSNKTCDLCKPLGECPFIRSVRKIDKSLLPDDVKTQEKIYIYYKAISKNCERAEEIKL